MLKLSIQEKYDGYLNTITIDSLIQTSKWCTKPGTGVISLNFELCGQYFTLQSWQPKLPTLPHPPTCRHAPFLIIILVYVIKIDALHILLKVATYLLDIGFVL